MKRTATVPASGCGARARDVVGVIGLKWKWDCRAQNDPRSKFIRPAQDIYRNLRAFDANGGDTWICYRDLDALGRIPRSKLLFFCIGHPWAGGVGPGNPYERQQNCQGRENHQSSLHLSIAETSSHQYSAFRRRPTRDSGWPLSITPYALRAHAGMTLGRCPRRELEEQGVEF